MMAKLWPGLSIALIALFLFLWLRSGCNKSASVDAAVIREAAAKAGYDSAKNEDIPKFIAFKKSDDSLRDILAKQEKLRQAAEDNLKAKGADLRRTLAALDQARAAHDTANRLTQGDSLESQVIAGLPVVTDYMALADSIGRIYNARMIAKDSLISIQGSLLQKADTTMAVMRQQFNVVHKDDLSKTKQLNFYKPAAKISIGIILAAILLHFVKL